MRLTRRPHDFRHLGWHPASGFAIDTPPTAVSITETTASIRWTMSEGSTAQVFYGETVAYGSSSTKENGTTYSTHVQVLTGLTENTLYHFAVESTNAFGVTLRSSDTTFTTESSVASTFPTPAPLAYETLVSMSEPSYLSPVTCANYGTEIQRISNVSLDRPAYSSKAAWNRDGSLLAINFGTGHQKILDGVTYAVLSASATLLASNMSWSDTNPLMAWRTSGNSILRLAFTSAGVMSTSGTWPLSDYSSIILGGYSGEAAGDYVPFCYRKASGQTGFATWRISTQTVADEKDVGIAATPTAIINNCGMSQSGGWLLAQYSATGSAEAAGLWRYDPANFANAPLKLSANGDHWDAGKDIAGNDIVVAGHQHLTSWLTSTGWSTNMFNIATGARTLLITEHRNPHHTCRNLDRPGYVYISSTNTLGESWAGYGDLIAVELADPPATSGSVEFYGKSHYTLNPKTYNADPMMSVSPDGTRVIWGTQWESSTSIYAYVAGVTT